MIWLVLTMVWTRRAQAVTLALLSLVAVAAATATPAYLLAADRAVSAGQIATALPAELGFEIAASRDEAAQLPGTETVGFTEVGAALADLPGFTYVYAAEYATVGIERDPRHRSRFTYRQDVCAHLTILSGRCLAAEGDVLLGEQAARRTGLAPGDPITLTYAVFSDDPRTPWFLPAGDPKPLTVAGVYRVTDPRETYWGAHGYFAADVGDRAGEPVFAGAATMTAMTKGVTGLSIDARADPGALRAADPVALRARLAQLRSTTTALGSSVGLRTGIPDLLDRIDSGRAAARLIVPVIAVPLVLLACLSIYLAVGASAAGRRPELAVVALRGARWWTRWWLATGESLVPIVAGAVAGCLAGPLLVSALVAALFPDAGVLPTVGALRWAPLAAAAAVLAALLAERRQLFGAVTEQLRRAPGAAAGAWALAGPGVVVMLAAAAATQLHLSGGDLTGLNLFATALVAVALALLAALAALPLIVRLAGRALRRGRLGTALAAFRLARRPGATALVTLLVTAVAITGYAISAVDVAAHGRTVTAELGNGADRVLTVQQVSRTQLLTAVRAIDPGGDFAMAVAQVPGQLDGESPVLAVDAAALSVAHWPSGAPPVSTVAGALRPAAPPPVVLPGQDVTVDLTATGLDPRALRLTLAVSSVTGRGEVTVQLGGVRPGPATYQQRLDVCRGGCRLRGIQLTTSPGVSAVRGRVTLRGLRVVNPEQPVLAGAQLSDPARWRVAGATASSAPDGLRLDIDAPTGLPDGVWLRPADAPAPLPVVTATRFAPTELAGFDGDPVPVRRVATLPAVPRLGTGAHLVDLEYLDRLSVDTGLAADPQIWLSADAPPDVLNRLADRGIPVVEDVTAAQAGERLARQGPAVALWFYLLAAVLAVVLAAGALVLAAVVDRPRRAEDLSALRVQGVSRRATAGAARWTHPALVLASVLAGVPVVALLWWLTGWALPLAGLEPSPLPLPGRPRAWVMAGVAAAVLLVLAGTAYLAGRGSARGRSGR